jgi:hypothetical protein
MAERSDANLPRDPDWDHVPEALRRADGGFIARATR